MNLDEDFASILVLSEDTDIQEGMEVRTTSMPLSVKVSPDLLGRVIDPFGAPLDGKPLSVSGGTPVPLERIAPGVTKRAPAASTPLRSRSLPGTLKRRRHSKNFELCHYHGHYREENRSVSTHVSFRPYPWRLRCPAPRSHTGARADILYLRRQPRVEQ